MPAFRFRVERKHFEMELFGEDSVTTGIIM